MHILEAALVANVMLPTSPRRLAGRPGGGVGRCAAAAAALAPLLVVLLFGV